MGIHSKSQEVGQHGIRMNSAGFPHLHVSSMGGELSCNFQASPTLQNKQRCV